MIHVLPESDYPRVREVCSALERHLAITAVIERTAEGAVYVDDPVQPTAALVRVGYRFHLSGTPGNETFIAALRGLFRDEVYPQALLSPRPGMFVLYYSPGWETDIEVALQGMHPLTDERVYLECHRPPCDGRPLLPPGFALRTVNRQLLSEELANLDALQEEMCSERASVADFLARSIGVCVVHGDEIVGWCLSEYNTGDRCEVGIETTEPYRRRGLATVMTVALVERARHRGINRIGWEAWASNEASIATARKAGFALVDRSPVHYAWFDEAENLSVHGNVHFGSGDYEAAVEWFERAFRTNKAPAWAYWVAACAYGRLGRETQAFVALRVALRRGYDDLEAVRRSPHLESLRETSAWQTLMDELEREPPGADGV